MIPLTRRASFSGAVDWMNWKNLEKRFVENKDVDLICMKTSFWRANASSQPSRTVKPQCKISTFFELKKDGPTLLLQCGSNILICHWAALKHENDSPHRVNYGATPTDVSYGSDVFHSEKAIRTVTSSYHDSLQERRYREKITANT